MELKFMDQGIYSKVFHKIPQYYGSFPKCPTRPKAEGQKNMSETVKILNK